MLMLLGLSLRRKVIAKLACIDKQKHLISEALELDQIEHGMFADQKLEL